MKCFDCGKPMQRAIVSGLPAWVCLDDCHGDCAQADHGFLLSWLVQWLPFDGMVIPYERGHFLSAWWAWFRHGFHAEDGEA